MCQQQWCNLRVTTTLLSCLVRTNERFAKINSVALISGMERDIGWNQQKSEKILL
jgi:hypothetical protein